MKDNCIFSKVFLDGTLLEIIYNPQTQETHFVIQNQDEIKVIEKFTDEKGIEYYPVSAYDDLILKNFVRLPSARVEPEDIKHLFFEVKDYIAQYMKLPDDFLTVSAVYVMLSWLYDSFNTLPYLRVVGTYGTGKSRFLQIMASLCYKSMLAGGSITTAGVFRTTDIVNGTLVFDEADFKASEMWSEIVKILNSGHTKGTPVVRMESNKTDGSFKTKAFNVYGAKILASRERFSDQALESRCITAQLLPLQALDRAIHLPPEFETKGEELRNKLLAFRFSYHQKMLADESTLEGLSFPRLKQSALALTSVASIIDKDVLNTVLHFLQGYENDLKLNQRNDIMADIMDSIIMLVWKNQILPDEKGKTKNKIYMLDISREFDSMYYQQYTDIPDRHSGDDGVITYKSGVVSPKRIGTYVQKLGIRKAVDSKGFYIPLPQEIPTIEALASRYGIEKPWETDSQRANTELPLAEEKDTKKTEEIDPNGIPF